MIRVVAEDVTDVRSFRLAWRWTDERYAVLTDQELARIQPLSNEKASEIWETVHEAVACEETVSSSKIATEATQVDRWLTERIGVTTPVIVCWAPGTAVLTDAELFARRWDDFCYPGSDDVIVLPLDLSWLVRFHYFELLEHVSLANCTG